MSNVTKFSIIIPVFNAEVTLQRCIDSVLCQDYRDFELILVNDGSTDASGSICDKIGTFDKRIRVVHKENGGVSSARNVGLQMAKGEWVVFVDSDDVLGKRWLSVYADNIENLGRQFLVTQRANIFNGTTIKEILHSNYSGAKSKDIFYAGGQYGYVWNKCFCKEIIHSANIRFDEKMACFEDEIFVLEYSQQIHSFYIPDAEPMYNYYLPNFATKYHQDSMFERQCYRYSMTKSRSHVASSILVDWLIMTMLKECAECPDKIKEYALVAKNLVGKDIRYAYGLKKILLRSTGVINISAWWICMVWIYSRFYKFGLLK